MDITNIAVSGMNAAEKRLANAANNIVNARTPDYQATDATARSLENGGVTVDIRERDPATVEVATENGTQNLPNVSLEQEAVNSVTASYDFQANAKLLKVQKELDKALLDIQA